MKILSRDFSVLEKVLIAILLIVLVGLAYYYFVDQPVRDAIQKANDTEAVLKDELIIIEAKVAELEKMQADLDRILSDPTIQPMPSYNKINEIRQRLNDILGDLGYRISIATPTKDGDQIRQNVSMSFTAPNYATVKEMLTAFELCPIRCKIGDVRISRVYPYNYYTGEAANTEFPDALGVSLTLTFYETMHDGVPDAAISTQ